MAVNKVVYNTANGEEVLMDLTNDTVTPQTLAKGATAHDASGEEIIGTAQIFGGETSETYVKEEVLALANTVDGSNGTFKMAFVTDLHNSDDNERLEHANQAIQALTRVNDIDLVVFGGDYIRNWTEITKDEAINDLQKCRNKFKNQVIPSIWLRGNHDTNGYVGERLTKEEAYNLIADKNVENGAVINTADPYGNYGYIDFADKKVRVIFVNTSDCDEMGTKATDDPSHAAPLISCHSVSATQLQWIADTALSFTESGWNVIFVSHAPLYWSTGSSPAWYNNHTYTDGNGVTWTCNLANMSNLIKAYINKTSFSATLNGATASKNFNGLSHYATIANGINGHQHAFLVNNDGLINYIFVGNACEGGKESADGNTYTKTDNTANDTTFDIIDFDFENEVANCWNYGAGYNRVVAFRYVASVFTINSTLTEVTSNNTATSITEGEAYTATLTATDGYILDSVVVTMGGEDVTSEVYADGVISIGSVTGNIAITATAVKDGYTNIIDTVGYTDGKRISVSSGNLSTADGYVTTGLIDLSGYGTSFVLRTSGVHFNYKNGMCNIALYESDGTFKFANTLFNQAGVTWNNFTPQFDGSGNLTLTYSSSTPTKSIKLSGYGSGANLIVTINEEITD